jgi:hypothetical protein
MSVNIDMHHDITRERERERVRVCVCEENDLRIQSRQSMIRYPWRRILHVLCTTFRFLQTHIHTYTHTYIYIFDTKKVYLLEFASIRIHTWGSRSSSGNCLARRNTSIMTIDSVWSYQVTMCSWHPFSLYCMHIYIYIYAYEYKYVGHISIWPLLQPFASK